MADKQRHHFLFITSSVQSHINPTLHLAKHLATSTGSAVTFSTTVFAHRRMFSSTPNSDQDSITDGLITFIPYSDGYDDGYKHEPSMTANKYHSHVRTNSKRNASDLVANLAGRGHPVTCVIYTILLNWAVEVAGEHDIPSVLYWIQTATVFATYYHFFHGFESLIKAHLDDLAFTVCLPGLQPFQIRDLPSYVRVTNADSRDGAILGLFREIFEILDKERERTMKKPIVLMNTFCEWETDALASGIGEIETIPVGFLPKDQTAGYLFKEDEKEYMEWLETKEEGSVVYISFGSVSVMKKEQMEEMVKGLKESKRPYLWVVRKDNREEALFEIEEDGEDGMVVEWCSQVRVLEHRAVGCFVTHCGWNSTLESLACGVPMVCVPQWSDQEMNAKLVESLWECGVIRSEVDGDGVVKGEEFVRCLELVMGDGEKGVEIRRKAKMWKDKALEAVSEGGSSDLNLRVFVEKISDLCVGS